MSELPSNITPIEAFSRVSTRIITRNPVGEFDVPELADATLLKGEMSLVLLIGSEEPQILFDAILRDPPVVTACISDAEKSQIERKIRQNILSELGLEENVKDLGQKAYLDGLVTRRLPEMKPKNGHYYTFGLTPGLLTIQSPTLDEINISKERIQVPKGSSIDQVLFDSVINGPKNLLRSPYIRDEFELHDFRRLWEIAMRGVLSYVDRITCNTQLEEEFKKYIDTNRLSRRNFQQKVPLAIQTLRTVVPAEFQTRLAKLEYMCLPWIDPKSTRKDRRKLQQELIMQIEAQSYTSDDLAGEFTKVAKQTLAVFNPQIQTYYPELMQDLDSIQLPPGFK